MISTFLYLAGCVMAGDAAEMMPGPLPRLAKYILIAFWPLWAATAMVMTVVVMIVSRIERIRCHIGGHKLEIKKDTGINMYHECRRCGERMVRADCYAGYQPVNRRWLSGEDCEL